MNTNTHVVCGQCQAVVRVPSDRLSHAPRCPQCHQALFAGRPVDLNGPGFETQLHRSDLPLVVDFWAPWCGPCRAMAPHFEEAARQLEPRFRFAKVNSDQEPGLSARFNIRSIPTLIVLHRGREIARQSGAMDAANLKRWLDSVPAG